MQASKTRDYHGESSDAASNVRAKIQNKGVIILEIVSSDAMNKNSKQGMFTLEVESFNAIDNVKAKIQDRA